LEASLCIVGLGCADLERTPFGACDSSHSLDNGHPTLYNDGEVHDLDLESASLRIAVRRLPHDISATKVHRIGEICKRIKEKMVLLRKE